MHSISLSFLSPGINTFYICFPYFFHIFAFRQLGEDCWGSGEPNLCDSLNLLTFYSAADNIPRAQFSMQCALPRPRLKFFCRFLSGLVLS